MHNNDTILLIHGLGGSRFGMWPISRRLKRLGYRVNNWSYRSVSHPIETHADSLAKELTILDRQTNASKIHVVTHSMGGVIARSVFANYQFENLGRVVMLAPPNRGSHAARKLTPLIGWLVPSLEQLSDAPDSFVNGLVNSLDQNEIEFGIIEASKDRVIAPGGVHLDGYRDFAVVDGHHEILTWYSQTISLVENFLVHGRFEGGESESNQQLRPI